MKAVAVREYGSIDNLVGIEVDHPGDPQVDTKVRAGTYDDYPDYYDRVPALPQIIGFDGAGVIGSIGPDVRDFKAGDEVFYAGSPIRHGSNAEYQLVDSRAAAHKPKSLSMAEAAAMPLTWITAYEALVERMDIPKGENAAILIINGSGGVGSVASQIARHVLQLPVVITTTSRAETTDFSKSMGATQCVNHGEDIVQQINDLKLEVSLKYVFITHTPTSKYIADTAKVCAPFGKVCSIVQDKEIPMYGTEFMAKSLTFVWELLGTKPYYGVEVDSHGTILKELAELLDNNTIKCHMTKELPMTVAGVREAHQHIENGGVKGKIGLSMNAAGVSDSLI